MMRITLLRHGKPKFELKGSVPAKELAMIAKSYNLSGIAGLPPSDTVSAMKANNVVVCSHLPRSIESADALGYSKVHAIEPLFEEVAMPYFDSGSVLLPVSVWIIVLRVLWILGFAKNGESFLNARRRAKHAASMLIEYAEEHNSVLLVGHGFMNYLIAKELRKRRWIGPSEPGRGYWEYGAYEKAAPLE